jgi:hypothetical protein
MNMDAIVESKQWLYIPCSIHFVCEATAPNSTIGDITGHHNIYPVAKHIQYVRAKTRAIAHR